MPCGRQGCTSLSEGCLRWCLSLLLKHKKIRFQKVVRDYFILLLNEKKNNLMFLQGKFSRDFKGKQRQANCKCLWKSYSKYLVPAVCPCAALFRWCSCRGAVSTEVGNNRSTWNYIGAVVRHRVLFPCAWDLSARARVGGRSGIQSYTMKSNALCWKTWRSRIFFVRLQQLGIFFPNYPAI